MHHSVSFQMANSLLSISPDFILPEDQRPRLSLVSSLASVPIIDLHQEHSILVQQIARACEDYGFFQIINHGVPPEITERMLASVTEFFELDPEEKAQFLTTEHHTKPNQINLFNYHLQVNGQEKIKMWSEALFHPWHPLHEILHLLPQNPPHYKEIVVEYAKEMGGLMRRLLGLISVTLGLAEDCIERRLGEEPMCRLQANYYPPCSDPELTLGLPAHTDLGALAVLSQSEGATGLHVIKDGEWVAINPIPNAFVVNVGDQIQVLSNGRYKSVHHRAVTNKIRERISLATFYSPNKDAVIGPIQDLIDEENPNPLYRNYRYAEFLDEFRKQEGTRRMVKELFQLHH